MRVGTKSLLFGAHQFLWHAFTVFLAWCKLYGLPNWKELICIIIHDFGYWGCKNMEGEEGREHPRLAAVLATIYLDDLQPLVRYPWEKYYSGLCLFHSRTFAASLGMPPSKLCWADKLCVLYDPWWLYLPRVYLSGEIHEYRAEALKAGLITESMSDREWYEWARERMIRKAYAQDVQPPYTEGS